MKVEKLEEFLGEIHDQPNWRIEANRAADYYDGNQLTSQTLQDMEDRGIPPIVVNITKPTVDTVLGMEAQTRRDWVVRGERDEDADLAEALTVKMAEAERTTRANRVCGDAYEDQVKVGIGFIHVGRNSDPFEEPYVVETVHRSELHWDWRARKPDLSDARYMVRERWYDLDEAIALFPNKKETLRAALTNEPWWDWREELDTDLAREIEVERDFNINEEHWRLRDRQRIKLYEVWYREYTSGKVLKVRAGRGRPERVVEFDPKDMRHQALVQSGRARVEKARFSKVRLAWWAGPHRMYDGPSPYPHNRFPYVPFIGYREDLTNTPYGLVRSMMSPQDEVNARRSKMLWLLSSSRTIMDSDATEDSPEKVAQEVARPDAMVVLNPARQNANGFQIQDGAQLSNQQYQALQESKANIQEASGIFGEAMGNRGSAEQSGVAIRELVNQSATTLGKINDNYAEGRRLTGELLLHLIVEDIGDEPEEVNVPAERTRDREEKTVVLNGLEHDEEGNEFITNRPQRLVNRVALDEVPSTSTYRQQYAEQLMEMVKTLPPEVQMSVADMIVEASDLPNRQDVADRIRRLTGQGKGAEKQQAQQAEMKQQEQQLQMAELEGKAREAQANAKKAEAEVEETRADTAHALAETEKTMAETEREDADYDMQLADEIAALARGELPASMQQQDEQPQGGGQHPAGPQQAPAQQRPSGGAQQPSGPQQGPPQQQGSPMGGPPQRQSAPTP